MKARRVWSDPASGQVHSTFGPSSYHFRAKFIPLPSSAGGPAGDPGEKDFRSQDTQYVPTRTVRLSAISYYREAARLCRTDRARLSVEHRTSAMSPFAKGDISRAAEPDASCPGHIPTTGRPPPPASSADATLRSSPLRSTRAAPAAKAGRQLPVVGEARRALDARVGLWSVRAGRGDPLAG